MLFVEIGYIENYDVLEKSELSRLESELGRKILSSLIFKRLGIKDYSIAIGEHGKPYIEGMDIHFNISHSLGIVAVAICDFPIGIDIERLREIDKDRQLSFCKRFFVKGEAEYLEKQGFAPFAFYYIWTRKEAYSKCLGAPLASSFKLDTTLESNIETTINNEYVLSIATNI